jgi:hypothetical protein
VSHKATNWLSDIDPALLSASEFRVLFYLCDCHNASAGCFPSQAYLRERAAVSNGTVNNVLNSLETKGLIQRHQSRDGRTKRQCPTRYILGFEMGKPQEPTPDTGDGNGGKSGGGSAAKKPRKPGKPSPETGVGADSNLRGDPTPISGATRLQPTGEEPVSNQEITSAGAREAADFNPMVAKSAERAVADWRRGRTEAFADLQPWVLAHIVSANLLTDQERQAAGLG